MLDYSFWWRAIVEHVSNNIVNAGADTNTSA